MKSAIQIAFLVLSVSLILSGCILSPEETEEHIIFGGDDPAIDDPGSVSVSGMGVYFKELDVDIVGGGWHDFTITMKNVGSYALDSVTATMKLHFSAGQ